MYIYIYICIYVYTTVDKRINSESIPFRTYDLARSDSRSSFAFRVIANELYGSFVFLVNAVLKLDVFFEEQEATVRI